MLFDTKSTQRVRTLTTKLVSSPLFPLLGLQKFVETVVAGGPTGAWAGYTLVATVLWVFADDIQAAAEEATD